MYVHVKFYCRPCKMNKQGTAPVEMSVVVNGERFLTSVGKRYQPTQFEKDFKSQKSNDLQKYLFDIRDKIEKLPMDFIKANIPLTMNNIKKYMHTGYSFSYTIENLFDEYYNDILSKRVKNKLLTEGTFKKYLYIRNMFYGFIDKNEELSTLTAKHIDMFVADVIAKYKNSTACSMLTKLKSVFNFAFQTGKITSNLFINQRIKKVEEKIIPLSNDDLNKIRNKEINNKRLERVRDVFLFACGTGLAYCDLKKLSPEDFKINDRGQYYIQKKRIKTGVEYCIVVLPEALEIARKYDFNLPVLSNQKMNNYYTELESLCDVSVHLHNHICRHTYASILLNEYHFPYEVIQKALGHSNIKQTQHYCSLFKNNVFEAFASIV